MRLREGICETIGIEVLSDALNVAAGVKVHVDLAEAEVGHADHS
jgi:hypothetical protein